MIRNAIDLQMELFQDGVYDALFRLLESCDAGDANARAAIRELAGYLRDDGAWRAELKNSKGWKSESAWEDIAAQIASARSKAPWWDVLKFANGEELSDDAAEFFRGGK